MNIGEAAARSGLSEDTIRFYEREGLFPPLARDAGGRRRFTPQDVTRLSFLAKLRQTGMSIEDMRRYVALAVGGDHTAAERRALLERHAERLRADIAMRAAALSTIESKIMMYRDSEQGGAPPCCRPGVSAARGLR